MQAIRVDRFGGPEVLQLAEVPSPEPGPGEVLIQTVASDVLYLDTMIRSGAARDFFPVRPPYIPGNGVAGTVVSAGDGIDPAIVGQPVVAHTGGGGGRDGYAEQAVVSAANAVEVPSGTDLLHALAVLHDGPTALRILERVGIRAGEPVLVLGAAGGMGALLLQLLRARDALVVGAARGQVKLKAVTEAGADAVVDYSVPGWTDQVLEAAGGTRPAVVLDGVGGPLGGEAFELVREGGRFSAHGAPSGSFTLIDPDVARRRQVKVTTLADLGIDDAGRAALARQMIARLTDGTVSPLIGQTFPLEAAAEAHAAIAARSAIGKTLLVRLSTGCLFITTAGPSGRRTASETDDDLVALPVGWSR
jgi:NADPH2:quinone reductase